MGIAVADFAGKGMAASLIMALPEATMPGGEQIGYDGLAEIVRSSGADVDQIMARIHAVEAGPRDDDQTVVMITRVF